MRDPLRLVSSFNRPNIAYSVRYQLAASRAPADQIAQLIGARLIWLLMCCPDISALSHTATWLRALTILMDIGNLRRTGLCLHTHAEVGDRAAVCSAGAMRQDNGGATPCCIVYTLKRESANEVAGRLTSKGKRCLL